MHFSITRQVKCLLLQGKRGPMKLSGHAPQKGNGKWSRIAYGSPTNTTNPTVALSIGNRYIFPVGLYTLEFYSNPTDYIVPSQYLHYGAPLYQGPGHMNNGVSQYPLAREQTGNIAW